MALEKGARCLPRFPQYASCLAWVLLLVAFLGCTGPAGVTIVTGAIEPRHLRFVTVLKPKLRKPGGWQAACIHIRITRSGTEESILCRFGIEMPIRNEDGPISTSLAQRVAAERINEAAHLVLGAATPTSPLGMLCETFKGKLAPTVAASIGGAMMTYQCHVAAPPVQFGNFSL